MANLGQKDGIYNIRFRYRSKEYKRSLKTRDRGDAEAAKRTAEQTIHRLLVGLIEIPPGIDPGRFIVGGGTASPTPPKPAIELPSTAVLIDEYRKAQEKTLAPSYQYSQGVHLRHFGRHLGRLVDASCDQVTRRDLVHFLQTRLSDRDPNTVAKERITLIQLYKWAVSEGYLTTSPAVDLPKPKSGVDRPPFRTIEEINQLIRRGGLNEEEILDLWECLYVSPEEIAKLLATVQVNSTEDFSPLLHFIPAYTGMRRGEILRLQWIDVNLDDGFVCARSRKQSRKKVETIRQIDLHPELREILTEWRKRRPRGQFLISDAATWDPIAIDRANRCFWQPLRGTEWCLDSKRNWFKIGFHTYRHSFASNLAVLGVDQRVIDKWMGHTTEAMRRRYQHLFPRKLAESIRSLSYDRRYGEVTREVPHG